MRPAAAFAMSASKKIDLQTPADNALVQLQRYGETPGPGFLANLFNIQLTGAESVNSPKQFRVSPLEEQLQRRTVLDNEVQPDLQPIPLNLGNPCADSSVVPVVCSTPHVEAVLPFLHHASAPEPCLNLADVESDKEISLFNPCSAVLGSDESCSPVESCLVSTAADEVSPAPSAVNDQNVHYPSADDVEQSLLPADGSDGEVRMAEDFQTQELFDNPGADVSFPAACESACDISDAGSVIAQCHGSHTDDVLDNISEFGGSEFSCLGHLTDKLPQTVSCASSPASRSVASQASPLKDRSSDVVPPEMVVATAEGVSAALLAVTPLSITRDHCPALSNVAASLPAAGGLPSKTVEGAVSACQDQRHGVPSDELPFLTPAHRLFSVLQDTPDMSAYISANSQPNVIGKPWSSGPPSVSGPLRNPTSAKDALGGSTLSLMAKHEDLSSPVAEATPHETSTTFASQNPVGRQCESGSEEDPRTDEKEQCYYTQPVIANQLFDQDMPLPRECHTWHGQSDIDTDSSVFDALKSSCSFMRENPLSDPFPSRSEPLGIVDPLGTQQAPKSEAPFEVSCS